MNSEKVKEIKKALECCNIETDCTDCPYSKIGDCIKYFNADILTLINELESENERLKKENQLFINQQINRLKERKNVNIKDIDVCKAQKNRIAELEKENKTKTDAIADLLKKQEFYEKEKLKQFAERLKDRKAIYHNNYFEPYFSCFDIDEALKEVQSND